MLDLPSETLTSNLRAIFLIRSFRIRLLPPPPAKSGELDLPRVVFDVLDWDVNSGGRNDPVFWDRTEETGRGKDDGQVQKVLRKWWFAECVISSCCFPAQN